MNLLIIKTFVKTINLRVCHGKNILSFKYNVIKNTSYIKHKF